MQNRQAASSSRSFSTGRSVVALLLLASVVTLLAANRNIALLHIPATMTSPIILENTRGTRVEILPLGAIIQRLWVADRDGKLDDVVLGFDTETPYKVAYDLGERWALVVLKMHGGHFSWSFFCSLII